MKFKEQRAIQVVQDAFVKMETSAEETLLLSLACVSRMAEQRRAAGLSVETGADALVHVGRGVAAATEAFASFSKAHPVLREILADMAPAYGPTETEFAQPFGGLSLVGSDGETATVVAA